MHDILVTGIDGSTWDEVAALLAQQSRRRIAIDPRLPRSCQRDCLDELPAGCNPRDVLIARTNQHLMGVAFPRVTYNSPESDKLTYWPSRLGESPLLAVCGNSDEDIRITVAALLDELDKKWRCEDATGACVMWPTNDADIESVLCTRGFSIDAYVALRTFQEPKMRRSSFPGMLCRRAGVHDLDSVVEIYMEVIDAHIPASPFAKFDPAAEKNFRHRFTRSLEANANGGDCEFVLVAEFDDRIVAIAECKYVLVSEAPDSILPAGLYGYINSFGVSSRLRRNGIGKAFEADVASFFKSTGAIGVYLWFSYYNDSASHFWPRHGYLPIWTSYQRRH